MTGQPDYRNAQVVRDQNGKIWRSQVGPGRDPLWGSFESVSAKLDAPVTVIIDAAGNNVEAEALSAYKVERVGLDARLRNEEERTENARARTVVALADLEEARRELAEEKAGRMTWQERAEELDAALTAAQARAEASEKDHWDLRAEHRKEFATIASLLRPILTACEDAS